MVRARRWDRLRTVALATLLVATALATGVAAQEGPDAWPMLQHAPDRRSSVGDAGGGTGKLIWRTTLEGDWWWGRSSPAVVGDTVYVGTRGPNGSGYVHALDVQTGERRWRTRTDGAVHSSPAVVAGTVYVGAQDGRLYALDASTGEVAWRQKLAGKVFSSPAVVDGTVYVGASDGTVRALDAQTGSVEWRFVTGGNVRSSPAVADGTVYVGSDDGRLYALDAATGVPDWQLDTGSVVESSPAVGGDRVYVGNANGSVVAVDRSTGTERWSLDISVPQRSPITYADGVIYFGAIDGTVWSVADGGDEPRVRWTNATDNQIVAGVAVAAGNVYVPSTDTRLYAFDAATGDEVWTYQHTSWIGSSPAVVDGRLHLFAHDAIFALDAGAGLPDDGGGDGGDGGDGEPMPRLPGPPLVGVVVAAAAAAWLRSRSHRKHEG